MSVFQTFKPRSLKPYLGLVGLLVIVAVCGGCKEEPPPPPPVEKPPPPPPPSAEQIAGEIRPILAPLKAAFEPNGFLPPAAAPGIVKGLREARAKHHAKENGPAALGAIGHEISEMVSEARSQGRWRLTLAAIDAYEALEPDSGMFNRVKELATLQMEKPLVKIKGFFTDHARDDETYAWLEVTDQTTQETHTAKVREGEEFDGFKLVKIIGTQQGVTLEYLKIPGDVFDVKID